MSDEGRVMPSYGANRRLTQRGKTLKGQRGSRHLAGIKAAQLWAQNQIKLEVVMCRADG